MASAEAFPEAPSISLTARTDEVAAGAGDLVQAPAPPSAPIVEGPETRAGAADAVPVHPTPVMSIVSDLDGYLDEIESLLRRAKRMVTDPAPRSGAAARRTDDD
jgi:hypothetical protein